MRKGKYFRAAAGGFLAAAICVGGLSGCKPGDASSSSGAPTSSNVSADGYALYEPVFTPDKLASQFVASAGESSGLHYVEDTETAYNNDGLVTEKPSKLPGHPMVADTAYPTDDVLVYVANVMDYGAKADGVTDDTGAIQAALNRVGGYGGGTVYIPAGTYRLDGTLRIPHAVTLRGDFRSPEMEEVPGNGTILLIYSGKGERNGAAAIRLGVSSGLQGMTIFYPEQTYEDVQVYPATVSNDHSDSKYGGHSANIRDLWFVNSYTIAEMGVNRDSSLHYTENVYGTPLSRGIVVDRMYDIGRIEGVYFSPQYLLKAAELGIAPKMTPEQYNTMATYVYEHAYGVVIYKSDWEYIYNYNAHGLNAAIVFDNSRIGSGDGQISHMTTLGCKAGILANEFNVMGWSVTNSWFTAADGAESYALTTSSGSKKGVMMFNNCRFTGKDEAAVLARSAMQISFANCAFVSENGKPGFESTGAGVFQLLQCDFKGDGAPVKVSDKAKRIQVLGCTMPDTSKIAIEKDNAISVMVDHTPLKMERPSTIAHQYKKTLPRPQTANIYYLYSYGAKPNTDCTQALKQALADAEKTGGTVYLPAGQFIISEPIVIPTNVELRGCMENQYHPQNLMGSTLLAKVPAGEDQPAFIQLSPGSGINGFSICYPDQFAGGKLVPYSWSVQSKGENTWAIAVCMVNSYLGMDFGTYPSDNHYVNGVTGAPIKVGIFAGNNSGNGWVENVQFNPGLGNATDYYKNQFSDAKKYTEFMLDNLSAFRFGYNEAEHVFGNFVYAAYYGMELMEQDGKAFNGLCIGLGVDNSVHSIEVKQVDAVEFTNSELTIIRHQKPLHYVNVAASNTGRVGIYNTRTYGQADKGNPSFMLDGTGTIVIQSNFIMESANTVFQLSGGNIRLDANIFGQSGLHVQAGSGILSAKLIGNSTNPAPGIELKPGMETLVIADNSGGKLTSVGSMLR